jgi:hypothetical protein
MIWRTVEAMPESKPRYEFRTWSQNLAELRDKLQSFAQPSRTERSQEIYLVSTAATDRYLIKIRHGQLDIKVLMSTHQGLELWQPMLKADFPLDLAVIATQLFAAFQLPAPQLSSERYEMREFLDDVIAPDSRIRAVDVAKTRTHFIVDGGQAEFAAVAIDNARENTVAVECEDPEGVLKTIHQLGIAAALNTSYARKIKQ